MTNKEAIEELKKVDTLDMPARLCEAYYMSIKALEQEPCGETVSLGVFKQVMWERDIAIGQLKELGYGFGQKIEPKMGHWIETDSDDAYWYMCSECHRRTDEKSDYCPNCGCRMVEPQESEDKE